MTIYSNTSPYSDTQFVGSYLDVITFRNLPYEKDDILFEITAQYEHRPDLLAYDLYQDSNLWWVFSVRNKDTILDPIYDMVAGRKIYLPKQTTMVKVLGI